MTKFQKIRASFRNISSISVWVLKLGMLAVALQASVLAIIVHDTLLRNPRLVPLYYPPALEAVFLSLTLVLCGAILFDILEKTGRK